MVQSLPTGELEFKIFAPEACRVEVVGSFTAWLRFPIELERQPDGHWTARATLSPGDHEFLYRIDGWREQADYAAHGVQLTRSGQWVSRLAVPRHRS